MRPLLAALVAVFLCLSPAMAQQQCGAREAIRDGLKNQYSEVPVARGLGGAGLMMELYASEDGKTWTLLIVHPNGMACFAATGESWQSVEAVRGEGA